MDFLRVRTLLKFYVIVYILCLVWELFHSLVVFYLFCFIFDYPGPFPPWIQTSIVLCKWRMLFQFCLVCLYFVHSSEDCEVAAVHFSLQIN